MRTRCIHEELGFERTGDIKKGLSLGKRERIHRWFREWAPVFEYEIRDDLSVHVGGYLDLRGSQVTRLPEGLSVETDLWLGGSQVTSLSEGLSVGGKIYINKDQDIEVPENLKHKINEL